MSERRSAIYMRRRTFRKSNTKLTIFLLQTLITVYENSCARPACRLFQWLTLGKKRHLHDGEICDFFRRYIRAVKRTPGFYLEFIVWGRSPEWPKATRFLGESGGMPPSKFFLNDYALTCTLVHFKTQFWEMLQWYFISFFSHDHILMTCVHQRLLNPWFSGLQICPCCRYSTHDKHVQRDNPSLL